MWWTDRCCISLAQKEIEEDAKLKVKNKIERLDHYMSYGSNGTQNTSRCAEEDAISIGGR